MSNEFDSFHQELDLANTSRNFSKFQFDGVTKHIFKIKFVQSFSFGS